MWKSLRFGRCYLWFRKRRAYLGKCPVWSGRHQIWFGMFAVWFGKSAVWYEKGQGWNAWLNWAGPEQDTSVWGTRNGRLLLRLHFPAVVRDLSFAKPACPSGKFRCAFLVLPHSFPCVTTHKRRQNLIIKAALGKSEMSSFFVQEVLMKKHS